MKQTITNILLLLSFAINANAQDPNKPLHAFSLNDCVQYAQKNNVQVKNALIAIDAQDLELFIESMMQQVISRRKAQPTIDIQ